MSSSGSHDGGEEKEKKEVVNHYFNSVMAPLKTLSIKEGVLTVEDAKPPRVEGTLDDRVQKMEEDTFRYKTVVERSLDAHHFMNLELENKIEDYKKRVEELEDKHAYVLSQL